MADGAGKSTLKGPVPGTVFMTSISTARQDLSVMSLQDYEQVAVAREDFVDFLLRTGRAAAARSAAANAISTGS